MKATFSRVTVSATGNIILYASLVRVLFEEDIRKGPAGVDHVFVSVHTIAKSWSSKGQRS